MGGTEIPAQPAARAPRPVARLDLLSALAATTAAVVAYVAALYLQVLPSAGFSVVLFAAAPLLAAVALPVIRSRARAENDDAMRWFGFALTVSLVAMVLQLISFPAVAPGGGVLRTDNTSNGMLYLIFHAAPVAGVAAAAARLPTSAGKWLVGAGSLLALATAANLVPTPELITADLRFTPFLIFVEAVLAVALAGAVVLWIRQVGRSARAMRGWAALSLCLICYDVILNAIAAERFTPVWWASLSLRVATYAVLAVGAVGSALADLRRLESYTNTELDRSDEQLRRSLAVTNQLLRSAEAMASAATAREVGAAVVQSCLDATGLPRASVVVLDDDTRRLRTVASVGYDERSSEFLANYPVDSPLPGPAVLLGRNPLFRRSGDGLHREYPGLNQLPVHARTECLAILPLLSAGTPVGLLVVSGDEPRDWSPIDRELLAGLAAQTGQAMQRVLLFERQRSAAEVLQRGLLPQRLVDPPGMVMAARYLPGAAGLEVGGDWYDCLPLPDGRIVLVVGDVMGKGVSAASRMGQIRHSIRVLARIDPAPAAVLAALDALPDEVDEGQIITLVYLLIDPAAGMMRLARAGHLPPVLVPPEGAAVLLEAGGSPPLGVPVTCRSEASVQLPPASTLVLFTDGLVESRRTGLDVGLPALISATERLAHQEPDVERLADAILSTMRGADRSDDVCLLVARFDPTAPRGLAPGEQNTTTLPHDLRSAAAARRFVAEVLDRAGHELPPAVRDAVVLLSSEIVTNALLHAEGPVVVTLGTAPGRIRLAVHDDSTRAPVRRAWRPLEESGRGMLLVAALADAWGVETTGTGKTVWAEVSVPGQ